MVKTHSDEYPFHQYPVTYQVTANTTSRHEYMILQSYSIPFTSFVCTQLSLDPNSLMTKI